mgnify:CR=1 FL=1
MTKLTTHVLDVYSGKPGKGIKVDLYYYKNDDQKSKINTIVLNNDGRSDNALIEGVDFKEGKYELIFFVGDYFKKINEVLKSFENYFEMTNPIVNLNKKKRLMNYEEDKGNTDANV